VASTACLLGWAWPGLGCARSPARHVGRGRDAPVAKTSFQSSRTSREGEPMERGGWGGRTVVVGVAPETHLVSLRPSFSSRMLSFSLSLSFSCVDLISVPNFRPWGMYGRSFVSPLCCSLWLSSGSVVNAVPQRPVARSWAEKMSSGRLLCRDAQSQGRRWVGVYPGKDANKEGLASRCG
jgi:hypothetical protein